jgi:hypothetical protein
VRLRAIIRNLVRPLKSQSVSLCAFLYFHGSGLEFGITQASLSTHWFYEVYPIPP